MKNKAYLNRGQREIRTYAPNSKTIVGSRRFGKSRGVSGPDTLRDIQHMPQGAGSFYQASFKQLLSRTIPETLQFLESVGFKQDIHYFVGRKAPKWMNFKLPYVQPRSWEHCIHVYNGSVIYMLSQDVQFSANSLTLDWLKCDEARSLKKEKLFEEVVPAVSGSPGKFENVPWHRGKTFITDKPTNKQGMWVLEEKKKMLDTDNMEVYKVVDGLLRERETILHKYGNNLKLFPHAARELQNIQNDLNYFRRYLYMYFEFDTIENIEIVRPEYIAEMKRTLPPITFQISIMNKLVRKDPSGFYANLDPDVHYYQASNVSYLQNRRTEKGTIDLKATQRHTCANDGDIDLNQPLYIACDYNANINWVVTGQPQRQKMKTLSSFFTKHNQKLRSVLRYWADYYEDHPVKDVVFYFDQTATDSAYADEEAESFADIVYNELKAKDWTVHMVYIGGAWPHHIKHQYINDALTGVKYLWPEFNQENNPHLLPALESAGVRIGERGFKKDKSGEKHADSDDDPLELRTDGTDAWDTLFIGLNFHPFTRPVYSPGSVILNSNK